MELFSEVQSASKPFQKVYCGIMLWFVGRAIQAGASVDPAIRKEFDALPPHFTFSLGVEPGGPMMIVGKDPDGHVRYLGWRREGKRLDLQMKIKSIEAALLMFTFQESTAAATARNRLIVDGDVPAACAIVRVLDAVEVYLLPKPIAKLAVKRYPRRPFVKKLAFRTRIYLHTVLGC